MSNSILRNPRPRAIDLRAALRSLIAALAALIALACATPAAAAPQGFSITRIEERTFPLPEGASRRDFVHQPVFDAAGTLQWDAGKVLDDGGHCAAAEADLSRSVPPRCHLEVLLATPRVERCHCERKVGDERPALEFFSGGGQSRWQRDRCGRPEPSCKHFASAGPDALIFSDHEVWSPITGVTVRPADLRLETRFANIVFLPERTAFFEFEADTSLFTSKGGYYLTAAASGRSELIKHVEARMTGYWAPAEMQRLPGTSLVAIVERWSTRGPGDLRFMLFDLDRREQVYTQNLWHSCLCGDQHIVPGPAGRLAVSFFDGANYHMVEYRIDTTQPGPPVAPGRRTDGAF